MKLNISILFAIFNLMIINQALAGKFPIDSFPKSVNKIVEMESQIFMTNVQTNRFY